MSQFKVLIIPTGQEGVGYFRSIKPHTYLREQYPDEFDVHIEHDPTLADGNDEWLLDYDLIHYHNKLGEFEDQPALLNKLDQAGVITVMDIDDYWDLPTHHPNYLSFQAQKMHKKILESLKLARNVSTTTQLFADKIRQYNKRVFVLPNAIDPHERQFKFPLESSHRMRIGWLGGSSHLKDLEILKGLVARLKNDGLMDKIQFVLCGFTTKGQAQVVNKKTGGIQQRPIHPHESQWYQYEKIFTDNYSIVSSRYKDFLMKFTQEEYPDVHNEAYRRVWSASIGMYAANYRLFDIALAPLVENNFNKCKSQLKVLEAGFYKKAVIAQDFGPYQIDGVNAVLHGGEWNTKGNMIMIDSAKNAKDWYKNIKRLVESPELINQLGGNLYHAVKDVYSIDKVTKDRRALYLRLLRFK